MNNFPNNEEEIELIKFIAKYQYLKSADSKYFFKSNKYYKERIRNLVTKKYIKRIKNNLVLDELGIEYAKLLKFEYNPRNRNTKYMLRLQYLSNLAAFYHNSSLLIFKPSFDIKDKECFTVTARRYIGILNINGIDYLTYSITKDHNEKYIKSIIYDIQKEREYKNIIILVNDISRINLSDFTFGMNQVLIVEDNQENRRRLQYLNSINWTKLVDNYLKSKVYLSEYNFCDYTDYKNKYISTFYFLDTEKVNRIKYFIRENKNKTIEIICPAELELELKRQLAKAHFILADLKEYIEEKRIYYD